MILLKFKLNLKHWRSYFQATCLFMKVHIISLGKSATAARGKKGQTPWYWCYDSAEIQNKELPNFSTSTSTGHFPRILENKGRSSFFHSRRCMYTGSATQTLSWWKETWEPSGLMLSAPYCKDWVKPDCCPPTMPGTRFPRARLAFHLPTCFTMAISAERTVGAGTKAPVQSLWNCWTVAYVKSSQPSIITPPVTRRYSNLFPSLKEYRAQGRTRGCTPRRVSNLQSLHPRGGYFNSLLTSLSPISSLFSTQGATMILSKHKSDDFTRLPKGC